jgi:protease I
MNQEKTDLELIAQTVQLYFNGMYNGDVESLQKAFHPEAYLFGYLRGDYMHFSAKDWFNIVKDRPVPSKEGEKYDMKIVSTDVTGEVAVVKVADLYMGLRFTDYLTLSKIEGNWVIVNKAFHHD